MIVRQGYRTLSSLLVACTALCAPSLARAQYYVPSPQPPSIELNLDVLDDRTQPPGPPQVEQLDLLPPVTLAAPEIDDMPTDAAEDDSPRLSRPFFTAPPVAEEKHAPVTRRRTAPPRPRPVIAPVIAKMQQAPVPVEMPAPVPMPAPVLEEKSFIATTPAPSAAPAAPEAAPDIAPASEPVSEPMSEPAASIPDVTLFFNGQDSAVTPALAQTLAQVLSQMTAEPEMRVQIRAYATGETSNKIAARRVSLARALSVRGHLMENGVKPNRIDVRAMGSETDTTPPDRVDIIFSR